MSSIVNLEVSQAAQSGRRWFGGALAATALLLGLCTQLFETGILGQFLLGFLRLYDADGNAVLIDDLALKPGVLRRDAVAIVNDALFIDPSIQRGGLRSRDPGCKAADHQY